MEERYTWEEIVNKYPDKWVCLKDCEMNNGDIVSAIVVAALDSHDIGKCMAENRGKGYRYRETTEYIEPLIIPVETVGFETELLEYDPDIKQE